MAEPLRRAEPSISRGKGGPSIGAPAGVGERVLAIPAGVDGLPGHPAGSEGRPSPTVTTGLGQADGTAWVQADGTAWEQVLDQLEARLVAWRAALRGARPFPEWFEWPEGLGACPERLRGRARAVLATQRDIEDEMTARRAALGALLHGIGTTDRRPPVPLFVDQRS